LKQRLVFIATKTCYCKPLNVITFYSVYVHYCVCPPASFNMQVFCYVEFNH